MDNKKFTVESLIQKLMLEADALHLGKQSIKSTGFAVFPEDTGKNGCAFLYPKRPVQNLDALRRFSVSLRALVKAKDASVAGIVCDLSISLEGTEPVPSILIYIDQKYGGMRVYIAPLAEGHLLFRDLGVAHPSTNFLPPLFVAEAYGPSVSEA